MAEMLNPGVYIQEVNASTIVPTVGSSVGVFAGDFMKGPVGVETLITSVQDLLTFYGGPTNANYNDFYQAYNFLQYSNKLLVSRASNVGGTGTPVPGETVATAVTAATATVADVAVTLGSSFTVGSLVAFDTPGGLPDLANTYLVTAVDTVLNVITLDRLPVVDIAAGSLVYSVIRSMNGVGEVESSGTTPVANTALASVATVIENASDYSMKELGLPFASATSKLKFTARNPGSWSNTLEICVANPSAFGLDVPSEAFLGIPLDSLFEYAPGVGEVGIVIKDGANIVETWVVSFDPLAKDHNNKSKYVENVINTLSSYVFVKDNVALPAVQVSPAVAATATTPSVPAVLEYVNNYCASVGGVVGTVPTPGTTLTLLYGADSAIQADDLLNAYSIFDNKDALDIDIVIANELDNGASARVLVDARLDCIGFIGANYADVVGQKATVATSNLVNWRKTGALNYNNMFLVACGNYKYQYDRYNDTYRWVNIAGDVAGLRSATSSNRASWWASAGLERGIIKNITRLAFNPTAGMRDLLYKNSINPIVAFPGQGTVMWGQKTLLATPSSFDRVNVRGLFNTLERALGKMAKFQVMELNDNFTRNRIVSMIKPYLDTVQSGRGIQDFLVICDESNNTPDVISRNQLIIDVYIKPTYVAEFIQLKFTNAGTNSFAQVIGA